MSLYYEGVLIIIYGSAGLIGGCMLSVCDFGGNDMVAIRQRRIGDGKGILGLHCILGLSDRDVLSIWNRFQLNLNTNAFRYFR
jgi:hypothetical protein